MGMLTRWVARRAGPEWSGWSDEAYLDESYQQRLREVQRHLGHCLNLAGPGAVRIISVCAGDGRDVLGALRFHPRRTDVSAFLVESDEQSVLTGRDRCATSGLTRQVTFVHGDATDFATYRNKAPGDVALLCGVWGHVPPTERARLVAGLASLVKPGGLVVWTRGVGSGRHRFDEIEEHFDGSSWRRVRVSTTEDGQWAVGTHRHVGPGRELPMTGRVFRFASNSG
jgi:hypothetical protein